MIKVKTQPTEKLLIRAYTNSEWDSCDFAIIHLSEEMKNQLQKRITVAKAVAENNTLSDFLNLSFWSNAVDFYVLDDAYRTVLEPLLEQTDWAFIEIDEAEENQLKRPENYLFLYKMRCYALSFDFVAYGKHSDEEFWTETVPYASVVPTDDKHKTSLKAMLYGKIQKIIRRINQK